MIISKNTPLEKKIKAYVGFALKANAVIYGVDEIIKSKKLNLIMVREDLQENSLKKLTAYVDKTNTHCLPLDIESFNSLLAKDDGIKVIAIKNENLSKAILECLKQ